MKNMVVSLALLLSTSSAFALTQDVKVCSVGREGQVYTTEFRVDGSQATMIVDGEVLPYTVDSVRGADLKRASAIAGEKVVQATQYVISSPQGTTTLQIAKGVSGVDYMLFPQNGILGASSDNCR
ncbi:MAG: hypothetical protein JSU04_06250 [Bdellovibrionales bacterium]|nr:hypothetical protein [Bdellovibrionales bacterium]